MSLSGKLISVSEVDGSQRQVWEPAYLVWAQINDASFQVFETIDLVSPWSMITCTDQCNPSLTALSGNFSPAWWVCVLVVKNWKGMGIIGIKAEAEPVLSGRMAPNSSSAQCCNNLQLQKALLQSYHCQLLNPLTSPMLWMFNGFVKQMKTITCRIIACVLSKVLARLKTAKWGHSLDIMLVCYINFSVTIIDRHNTYCTVPVIQVLLFRFPLTSCRVWMRNVSVNVGFITVREEITGRLEVKGTHCTVTLSKNKTVDVPPSK